MLRLIAILIFAGALAYCGTTVKLGNRTLFEHVQAIWKTEEVQDLTKGVKETAGPTVDRMKKGVQKGYEAATEDDAKGSGSGTGSQAAPVSP
jgi:hypothetical protein